MTLVGWSSLILFWLLLAAAAISDVRSRRISNILSVATLAAGTALLLVRPGAGPWWQHGASFAIMLAVGFALFSAGWIGGGDAKLAAAAAVPFDLREFAWFVEATAIAGGLLALVLLVRRRLSSVGPAGEKSVPYGVAIAIGAIAVSAGFAS